MKKYIKNIVVAAVLLGSFEFLQAAMNQTGRSLAQTGTQFGRYVGANGFNAVGATAGSAIAASGIGQTRNLTSLHSSHWGKFPNYDSFAAHQINHAQNSGGLRFFNGSIAAKKERTIKDTQALNTSIALSAELLSQAEEGFDVNDELPGIIEPVPPLVLKSEGVGPLYKGDENVPFSLQFFQKQNNRDAKTILKETNYDYNSEFLFEIERQNLKDALEAARVIQQKLQEKDPYGFDENGKYIGLENGGIYDKDGNMQEFD